jgi:hypothetical protein
MSGEVLIPEEAVERAAMPLSQYMARSDTYDAASDALRVAAPLILAAALDELIKKLEKDAKRHEMRGGAHAEGTANGLQMAGTTLHRHAHRLRAAVLRGEEGQA